MTSEPRVDRRDGTPVPLQRAMAFIDANAHVGITVVDTAAAMSVTQRTVQYVFRRYLGCTPTEYLRLVRLDGAHADLVAADVRTATVGQVAEDWGFHHVGRFAVMYRQRYGVSPSDTLRSAAERHGKRTAVPRNQ